MAIKTALLLPLLAVVVLAQVAQASTSAAGQSIESAHAAFDEGRFLDAASLAEATGTAQGLTLANLSLVTYGYFIADDAEKQGFYRRAMDLGERAVELDPGNAESVLRWGQAMGRYAPTLGIMKALRQGYFGRMRKAFETALSINPNLAEAHISLGAWHAEAVKEGGFMARATLGASKKTGAKHYELALELAPDSKAVGYEYARGLLLLNERGNRERAREMYQRALEIPSSTAVERLLDEKTARKLAKLEG